MQYEKYQRKIEKIASVMKWIFKHMTMVIAVASATVVTSAALVAAKGTVTKAEISSDEIYYGESITAKASAFLSSTQLEYAEADGGDWSSEAPTMPGTYKVRAVAKAAFGTERDREIGIFTILPKEITVTAKGETLMLGDTPEPYSDGLVKGDTLRESEFDIEYLEGTELRATPISGTVVIRNEDGENVTRGYSITVSAKALKVVPREITVVTGSSEKMYDGTPLVSTEIGIDESSERGLLEGHVIVAEFPSSVTYVGTVENVIDASKVRILDADGVDVTRYYKVSAVFGSLTVTKRTITVESSTESYVYQGAPYESEFFSVIGDIPVADGDRAVLLTGSKITNVGKISNIITVAILNADDKDITANYEITYVFGTIEVTKRDITVTTVSSGWIYDGESHSAPVVESYENLVEGHSVELNTTEDIASIRNFGELSNRFKVIVLDADGEDVSANYEISYNYGLLSVEKRDVYIAPDDIAVVYDDIFHTAESASAIPSEQGVEGNIYYALVDGHYIVAEFEGSQRDVGTATVKITKVYIYYNNSGNIEDVSGNYEIAYGTGTVEITAREVIITTGSDSHVYDAEEFYLHSYTANEGGLVDGHTASLEYLASITNVGSTENLANLVSITSRDGRNVTGNYLPTVNAGTLEVTKREVTVHTATDSWMYDALAHSNTDVAGTDNIVHGHVAAYIEDSEFVSLTSVGELSNVFEVMITDKNGEDVSANYKISYKYGTVSVTKRPIYVSPVDVTVTYDDLEHGAENVVLLTLDGAYFELVGGHYFHGVEFIGSQRHVGESETEISAIEICVGEGVDREYVTGNYDIHYGKGSVKVEPKTVTLLAGSASQVYDGTALVCHDYTVTAGGFIDGHFVTVTYEGSITRFGSTKNVIASVTVLTAEVGGEDVTDNYLIDTDDGTLEITKREITVSTGSYSWEYDGNSHSFTDCFVSSANGLGIEGHTVSAFGAVPSVTNVILDAPYCISNEYEVIINNPDGEDVTDCYIIHYDYGTIAITQREITVKPTDVTVVYDATEHFGKGVELAHGSKSTVLDHVLACNVISGSGINAGEYVLSILAEDVKVMSGENDVTYNYSVSVADGVLEILKRNILIYTGSDTKMYDGTPLTNGGYGVKEDEAHDCYALVAGHVMDLTVTGTRTDAGTSDNTVDFDSIVIKDALGNDVTENYNYSEDAFEPGALTVTKRPIYVSPVDVTVTYDDMYHSSVSFTQIIEDGKYYPLVSPHSLADPVFNGGGREVGEYESGITSIEVYVGDGEDRLRVTDNYDITYGKGKVTIDLRQITITTGSASRPYDGSPLVNRDCSVEGFISTHHFGNIEYLGTITYVGSTLNEVNEETLLILSDGDNRDVTKNYEIIYVWGTLEITKRYVTVNTGSHEWIYDGNSHSYTDCFVSSANGLGIAGHTVSAFGAVPSVTNVIVDAPYCVSNVYEVIIKNPEGKDVTANYVIDCDYGTIRINPRPITVKPTDVTVVYDAEEHFGKGVEIDGRYSLYGTVEGHSLVCSTVSGSGINAGRYSLVILASDVRVMSGEDDLTYNYTVSVKPGVLEILKRDIFIYTGSADKTYDATPLTDGEYGVLENASGYYKLVTGHSMTLTLTGARTDAGSSYNTVDFGSIRITDAGGNDVTANYNFSAEAFEPGVLRVDKRKITLTAHDAEWIFNGEYRSQLGFTVTSGSLVDGHEAWVYSYTEVIFGCENVPNEHEYRIRNLTHPNDYAGRDLTDNYEITAVSGKLTVNKVELTISTEDREWLYDGFRHSTSGEYTLSSGALVDGHSITVTSSDISIRDAGSVKNSISVEVYNSAGERMSDGYLITYDEGTLTVRKRSITVTGESYSGVYDGATHYNSFYTLTGEGMAPGEWDILDYYETVRDAGSKTNTVIISVHAYRDGQNVDVTANYDITYVYGKLQIDKRAITVTTDSATVVYDGFSHAYPGFTADNYAPNQTAAVNGTPTIVKAAGKTNNKFEVFIYEREGSSVTDGYWTDGYVNGSYATDGYWTSAEGSYTDVTANYEITYVYGSIEVKQREITLRPTDHTYLYDDTVKYPEEILDKGETTVLGWHTLDAEFKGCGADAGVYTVSLDNVVIKDGDVDVTENYRITLESGIITITRRVINVTTGSAEKMYDGTPLTSDEYTVSEDSDGFVRDHVMTLPITGSQLEVGSSNNTVDLGGIKVMMGTRDVTGNYEINVVEGTLTVTPSVTITVITNSAKKEYDGTPLTAPDYIHYIDGELLEGHVLSIKVVGSRTEVGISDNAVIVTVTDAGGKDVTRGYRIDTVLGTLTVTGDGETDDERLPDGGDGGMLDTDGDLSAGPELGDGAGPNGDNFCYYIVSDTSGFVYLKVKSFGDFTGTGWEEATAYDKLIYEKYAAAYLMALAAQSSGLPTSNMSIVSKYNQYALPYYALPDNNNPLADDTVFASDASKIYSVVYIMVNDAGELVLPEELSQYEYLYRQFVYENYLAIDEYTEDYMVGIIEENGWSRNTEDIIRLVAEYIQNAAVYKMDFDQGLVEGDNIVVDFLDVYKEGVCRHYASAATMLYRALGIPARYTIGFAANVDAGENTYITAQNAHAWVEVYIDGLGWVAIEVTGSGEGSDDIIELPEDEESDENTLVIRPEYVYKEYDGTPLYAVNKLEETGLFAELLAAGYTYTVEISGERTTPGVSFSRIVAFNIFDRSGMDVTYMYDVQYEFGKLEVVVDPIIITLYEIQKYYDGTPLEYADDDYEIISIPDGYRAEISINISLTKVGSISVSEINNDTRKYISYRVYDEMGNELTDRVRVIVDFYDGIEEYDPITVLPVALELTASSATKPYDGEALTCPSYYISLGYLAAGDTLTAVVSGSITGMGQVSNEISRDSIRIVNASGEDVTDNYEITLIRGTLTVEPPTEQG